MKYILLILTIFSLNNLCGQIKDSMDIISIRKDLQDRIHRGSVEGKALPAFVAKDLNGHNYTNRDLKSKVTFLNFWFASCHPCIKELPYVNRLYNMFKDSAGFQFYSMTFETKENARLFMEKYGVNFPVLLVPDSTIKLLEFGRGFPTNILLDSQGNVHTIYGEISWPKQEVDGFFKPEIEKLLKGH